ncbi:MAG: hypothetical protein K9M98_07780 [Cephaloticoccus sp.]|nr:hypothetical protein [Cephaloticoccus sp.]MCF7760388.1 hypothetical protein [Cephaloticoccus sp.]
MKKAYVIFPVLAMLIFFGFWWNFSSVYDAKQAAIAQQIKLEKQQKLEQEANDRAKAIQEAVANQAIRKAEREAREAQKQKDREERQAAKEASQKAFRDKEKLARQSARLAEDVKAEQDAIAKLEDRKKFLIGEKSFLREYVLKAESNQNSLTQVIQKIIAADEARAKAAKAAAEAAKRNS